MFSQARKVVAKNGESFSFNRGLTEASKSGSKRLQNLAAKTKRTDMIVCLRCKRK